jgi:hypothetical protein
MPIGRRREPGQTQGHFMFMRALSLACLCLGPCLWAGGEVRPGYDPGFISRITADTEGGAKPWKRFRVPEDMPSAVVEVVGELTKEELRQITFQEFLVWFHADLRKFWRAHGYDGPAPDLASATLPVTRYGGNPVPGNVPLGRVHF